MKQPLSYFLILFLCVLFSCKKESEAEAIDEPGKEELYTNDSITVEDITPYDNPPEKAGEYSFLGYGYDLTGRFADAASVKKQVIDIERVLLANAGIVRKSFSTISGADEMSGDAAEIARQISYHIKDRQSSTNSDQGSKRFFKGELTSFFSRDSALSGQFIYGYYSAKLQVKNVKMYVDDFSAFTLPLFQEYIQKRTPAEIIDQYGTHILCNISLGGRITAFYQSKTGNKNREEAAKAGFTVAIGKILGTTTGYLDYWGLKSAKGDFNQRITLDVTGADISKIRKVVNPKTGVTQIDFSDWQRSLTRENAGMINIREVEPIYVAIADPVKKEEVKKYLEAYLAENEVKVIDK